MWYMGAYPGVGACPGHYGTSIVPCSLINSHSLILLVPEGHGRCYQLREDMCIAEVARRENGVGHVQQLGQEDRCHDSHMTLRPQNSLH